LSLVGLSTNPDETDKQKQTDTQADGQTDVVHGVMQSVVKLHDNMA